MAAARPFDLTFKRENETKNKFRYQEQDIDKAKGPVVDKLYMSKKALKAMGNPEILHVHIAAP